MWETEMRRKRKTYDLFWCALPAPLQVNPAGPHSSSPAFRVKFSIRCSRGGFPPEGWKLSYTATKAVRGGSESQRALDYVVFSTVSSLINGSAPVFPCSLRVMQRTPLRKRISQNGCWGSSGMRRAACSPAVRLFLSSAALLSPSLPRAAPPHPFLSSLLPSFPFIHTLRYALLWLPTITAVPFPAVSHREVHRPYSSEKQITLDKYALLTRCEETEQQHG